MQSCPSDYWQVGSRNSLHKRSLAEAGRVTAPSGVSFGVFSSYEAVGQMGAKFEADRTGNA